MTFRQSVSFTATSVFSKTDCLQPRYLSQHSTEAIGGNKSYSPDKADCTPSSQRPTVQRDELAKIPCSHWRLPLPFHTWADTMETQHHGPTLIYFKTFCRIKQNIVHVKIVLRQLRGCSILGTGCSTGQETTGWYKKNSFAWKNRTTIFNSLPRFSYAHFSLSCPFPETGSVPLALHEEVHFFRPSAVIYR